MRKVWKWVIGVVVALVVIAVIAGGVWLIASRIAGVRYAQVLPPSQGNPVPRGNNGPYGNRVGPNWMMPYGGHYQMMRGGGFGFGIIPGIIGFIFFLVILALVVLGIVWLVTSLSRRSTVLPPAPATQAAPAVVNTHLCSNCGQPVQNGFTFCPNCGAKQ